MLNETQVQEQKARFESFMSKTNLAKIGERIIWFMGNDNEDGRYNSYCYIHRVLGIVAKVGGSYYHPDTIYFYSDMLQRAAIDKLIEKKTSPVS